VRTHYDNLKVSRDAPIEVIHAAFRTLAAESTGVISLDAVSGHLPVDAAVAGKWRYHIPVKAAALFLALCLPALADFAAGLQAIKNGDYATPIKEFLPLAEQGNAFAQFNLAAMYIEGHGVLRDYAEAVRWTAKPPNRDTRALSSTSASRMIAAKECRGITPKPPAGSAKPLNRETRALSSTSASRMILAKECRRTTPRLSAGTSKPPDRDMPVPSSTWA
jgi:hypothetical protein